MKERQQLQVSTPHPTRRGYKEYDIADTLYWRITVNTLLAAGNGLGLEMILTGHLFEGGLLLASAASLAIGDTIARRRQLRKAHQQQTELENARRELEMLRSGDTYLAPRVPYPEVPEPNQ